MKVTFWGTRGSLPTPLTAEEFYIKVKRLLMKARYIDLSNEMAVDTFLMSRPIPEAMTFGGNTPCVEMTEGDGRVVIDCGSGLGPLGRAMMESDFKPGGRVDILQTHTHWDHMIGFPFFAPAYTKGSEIHIHGIHPELKKRFEQQMDLVHFPITIDDMAATIIFHQHKVGEEFLVGPFSVTSKGLHHPGGSYSYRIESGGKSVVFASDGEYKESNDGYLQPYVDFYRNADVLIFDSMYATLEKVIEKENFGHSTPVIGIGIALKAGVKTLVLYHHDPECNDAQIAQSYFDAKVFLNAQEEIVGENPLSIVASFDGLVMDI